MTHSSLSLFVIGCPRDFPHFYRSRFMVDRIRGQKDTYRPGVQFEIGRDLAPGQFSGVESERVAADRRDPHIAPSSGSHGYPHPEKAASKCRPCCPTRNRKLGKQIGVSGDGGARKLAANQAAGRSGDNRRSGDSSGYKELGAWSTCSRRGRVRSGNWRSKYFLRGRHGIWAALQRNSRKMPSHARVASYRSI